MNFQEMYNTSVLFGTQEFPKTKYNVFKQLLLWYKIGASLLCFYRDRVFFSKCGTVKESVACFVVVFREIRLGPTCPADQLTPVSPMHFIFISSIVKFVSCKTVFSRFLPIAYFHFNHFKTRPRTHPSCLCLLHFQLIKLLFHPLQFLIVTCTCISKSRLTRAAN